MDFRNKDEIRLLPKTRFGRNRLSVLQNSFKNWNSLWTVREIKDSVAFSKGKRGPWLLVAPNIANGNHDRWVHATDDENFAVEIAVEDHSQSE